jgi:hypothetical protein
MERKRHPISRVEIQLRRLDHAVSSQAIEGNPLTSEEVAVFKKCILNGKSFEERTAILRDHFPNYERGSKAISPAYHDIESIKTTEL